MDEPANGKSALRSVKGKEIKKVPSSITFKTNPRVERRRKILLERRNNQLIQIWRIFFFGSISYGLSLLIIENGWSSIDASRIKVNGALRIDGNQIIKASRIDFPKPLLEINLRTLKQSLANELPVNSVSTYRQLIPPKLHIYLTEREPVAYAQRRVANGVENGMVDKSGEWMPIRMATMASQQIPNIYIEGWMLTHQSWIAKILQEKENLGSPLRKIIISPNGEVILNTKDFETIFLGSSSYNLNKQIKALNHLSKNLPKDFLNKRPIVLDMQDPSKPEFQIKSKSF